MQFVTIKEAVGFTGKNEMTIRRFVKKPASKAYVKQEEGKLYICKDYLCKHYPPLQPVQKSILEAIQTPIQPVQFAQDATNEVIKAKDEIIQSLRNQLDYQTKTYNQVTNAITLELERKTSIIIELSRQNHDQSERLREMLLLLADSQQQLKELPIRRAVEEPRPIAETKSLKLGTVGILLIVAVLSALLMIGLLLYLI
jgi:small-conductance mechanosensitive channel